MNKKILLFCLGAYLLGSYFPLSAIVGMFKKQGS